MSENADFFKTQTGGETFVNSRYEVSRAWSTYVLIIESIMLHCKVMKGEVSYFSRVFFSFFSLPHILQGKLFTEKNKKKK